MTLCTMLWYIVSMRVSIERIRSLCRGRGQTLGALLASAGVSRNAFYTLARRESVLPNSLRAICAKLGATEDAVLTSDSREAEAMKSLLAEARLIAGSHGAGDFDNIRHTLLLLREPPLDRIRRALDRAPSIGLR